MPLHYARPRTASRYRGLTKDVRAKDLTDALQAMMGLPWFGRLLLVGHSEGADVATAVAMEIDQDRIASIGFLSGAAPTLIDIAVEVLRKQPGRSLRYLNYAGLDHDFSDSSGEDRSAAVFDSYIRWSLSKGKVRSFELIP